MKPPRVVTVHSVEELNEDVRLPHLATFKPTSVTYALPALQATLACNLKPVVACSASTFPNYSSLKLPRLRPPRILTLHAGWSPTASFCCASVRPLFVTNG